MESFAGARRQYSIIADLFHSQIQWTMDTDGDGPKCRWFAFQNGQPIIGTQLPRSSSTPNQSCNMGIDTVELIMDVEESFDIKIPDDDAQQIVTVGDLFKFVKAHAELAPAGTCLTAATFYDIRKGLRSVGIQKRFGPSTPLAEILPENNRRLSWATLARNTQLRLPSLVRPSWVVVANVVITMCASIAIAFIVSERDLSGFTFFAIGITCLFIIGSLTSFVTTPFATQFATEFGTFRRLSERVLALNTIKLKNEHAPMGPNDVWIILREIIVSQLGVDADEVTPDASFVKDLGCE